MPELLKREVSLTVLRMQLLDHNPDVAQPGTDTATPNSKPSRNTPDRRARVIRCELQVTGDIATRGLIAPEGEPELSTPSRRKRNSNPLLSPDTRGRTDETPAQTLAEWIFTPEELHLPVHYKAAMQFQDEPGAVKGWLAGLARLGASTVFNEIRSDALQRLASSANWLPSGEPTLPAPMARQLETLLRPPLLDQGDCLWLELVEPAGYLPLLPWEKMLRPYTTAPILRLSPHEIKAASADRKLCVVVCISAPFKSCVPPARTIEPLLREIRRSLPERSTLHVFADDLAHAGCFEASQQLGEDTDRHVSIELHPMPPPPTQRNTQQGAEPWRDWIVTSMAGTAVEVVQFIVPGMLFPDRPRVITSRAPTSSRFQLRKTPWSFIEHPTRELRYFSPLELSQFLNVLGAWGAVFSSPPGSTWTMQSRMSLRLVVDQITRLRPGVTVLHDPEADVGHTALGETYRFIIGDPSIKASASSSVCVYCHPSRAVQMRPEPDYLPGELLQQYALLKHLVTSTFAREGKLPAWVATTQRVVEQAISRTADSPADDPSVQGLTAALKYVQKMISERGDPSRTGSAPQTRGATQ
jgi:hypothetical protein